MLAESGFDPENPDPRVAWRTFRAFAAEPIDAAGDGVLFETGIYAFTGESEFQLDFTRQFEIEVDGEYEGMQQLHLTFFYAPSPSLEPLTSTLWSFDCSSLDEFFERVEGSVAFRTPVEQFRPLRYELRQEEV
jgi:hypothetical protein